LKPDAINPAMIKARAIKAVIPGILFCMSDHYERKPLIDFPQFKYKIPFPEESQICTEGKKKS
jgi:hypothetical protein